MMLIETFHAANVAVQLDHVAIAGSLMEPIDILRNEGEIGVARDAFSFEIREGNVAGIRTGLRHFFATPSLGGTRSYVSSEDAA